MNETALTFLWVKKCVFNDSPLVRRLLSRFNVQLFCPQVRDLFSFLLDFMWVLWCNFICYVLFIVTWITHKPLIVLANTYVKRLFSLRNQIKMRWCSFLFVVSDNQRGFAWRRLEAFDGQCAINNLRNTMIRCFIRMYNKVSAEVVYSTNLLIVSIAHIKLTQKLTTLPATLAAI